MRYPQGIDIIDNGLFGKEKYGATYLLGKKKRALVDTGVSYSKEKILDGLRERGISFSEVKYIFLTHIHLDHAGCAGYLLDELPEARVIVHQKGSPHLIDPSRLIESVKKATGERFGKYGDVKPLPSDRVIEISEERKVDLGKEKITVFPTPGHAPHHLAYFDPSTGALFSGDAGGINLDGDLYPTTPPPSFDLEKSIESLEKMKNYEPDYLLYAHYGLRKKAGEGLENYKIFLRNWVGKVKEELSDHSREETKKIVVDNYSDLLGSRFNETELKMNIEGVFGYLSE